MMQELLAKPSITCVQPTGHINAANSVAFQKHLESALEQQPHQSLLVDLSHVESLDSAGLMALISARALAQRSNVDFHLCGVSPTLRIIFEVTQLDRVFQIHPNRAAAEALLAA